MSIAIGTPPPRRVRHQARDVLAVMAFSAGTSLATSLIVMLLLWLGRQG